MTKTISITATSAPEAQAAKAELEAKYDTVDFEQADTIVALGGDGLMLQCLHKTMNTEQKIFGMHCGSVGFLMNNYAPDNLPERLAAAQQNELHPLKMTAQDMKGKSHEALAINEVSITRNTAQAAKLKISVDGRVRMEELVCDGALVATPAGSTAYNFSAHGPILPIEAQLLALTPISAFRPRRWRGALLPDSAQVHFDVLEPEKRPVSAVAGPDVFANVTQIDIVQDNSRKLLILFDKDHSLDERILSEQFLS